jgi:tight adherence protein C
MLLLIAVSAFLTVILAVIALGRRSPSAIDERITALASRDQRALTIDAPIRPARTISSPARSAIGMIRAVLPDRWYHRVERALREGGDPVDPGLFLLLWVAIALPCVIVGGLLLGARGFALGAAIGFLGPLLWLRRVGKNRRARISRALPDAIDLLVACVEAGLGIEAALIRVGEVTDGPLGEELRRTLGEISVGRARQEALLDLGARTGVADLDGFLRPVVQGERAGVSIGSALRVQAEALRERRRQRAKEKAEKLPAKMVIPMTLFFLPCVMIIGFAPAAFELIKIFRGLGF